MPRLKNKVFVLAAAMIAVLAASLSVRAGRTQAPSNEYMLDNSLARVYLYPGFGWRSYIESKYEVPSLEELERRVGQLPPGAKLHWTPYKRERSGKPILFSEGQYDHFAKFCRDHKIELLIPPGHPK